MAKQEQEPQAEQPAQKPELQDTYIVDVAGNMSIVKTVKGERPKPGTPIGPFGSRVATPEQIAAYKGITEAAPSDSAASAVSDKGTDKA